jgi:hypothetical protein
MTKDRDSNRNNGSSHASNISSFSLATGDFPFIAFFRKAMKEKNPDNPVNPV